jgi:coniferyl-aldehyde dehydrogenase
MSDPMSNLLEAMQAAQRDAGPPDAALRLDRLERMIRLLDANAERFCEALDADFGGRSRLTSLMSDLLATTDALRYAKRGLRGWMQPQRRRGVFPFNLFGARVEVQRAPKGVVGILGTWNVPLFTTISPLAFVLAAGNRAMIKPSETVPRTSELLASTIAASFAPDEIAVVQGGPEVSARFAALPFDHLVLTGSDRTGRKVMQAAAERLTPLTLELGGKSPVILGSSVDLGLAARRILAGKVMNAGQICVSPDTVYVSASQLESFIEACRVAYAQLVPGGVQDTAVVSESHHQRVQGIVAEASAAGARVVVLGAAGATAAADGVDRAADRRPALTLVVDPPAASRLAREEIFGPVMQIETCKDADDAVARIQRGPSPLALYYFGRDAAEERRVIERTRSGGVTVNDVVMHVAALDAPFGGVGGSGFGRYHGREGFEEFSHARTVYRSGWWDPRRALGFEPPYGPKTYDQLRRAMRR